MLYVISLLLVFKFFLFSFSRLTLFVMCACMPLQKCTLCVTEEKQSTFSVAEKLIASLSALTIVNEGNVLRKVFLEADDLLPCRV